MKEPVTWKPVTWTMGRDQYGERYDDLGAHPRAELMRRIGCSHATRMFMDYKSSPPAHIGYIIAGRWITLYNVTPWQRPA